MTELEKLAQYLTEHRIPHIWNCIPYFDADGTLITGEPNQIIVFSRCRANMHSESRDDDLGGAVRSWDAICYRGTYGWKDGLLEIMGDIVQDEGSSKAVEGWLTADDVIRRLERRPNHA